MTTETTTFATGLTPSGRKWVREYLTDHEEVDA